MKVAVVLALVTIVACASAIPLPEEDFESVENLYDGEENAGIRQRRVTCDLLSIGGKISLSHSACAANCLSMGKAGGRCNDGICQCRKTTFKELWDKRFG